MKMGKGWRTIAANIGLAALAAGLEAAGAVDWSQHTTPIQALVLSNLINIGLRMITTTGVGKSE